MIAVGLGCRTGCAAGAVLELLEQALLACGCRLEDIAALYTADFKSGELGLRQAAERLSRPLVLLSLTQLQAQAAGTLTCSAQSLERFGLPSIAETAALAGALQLQGSGARPRLLAPRRVAGSATCALASGAPGREPAR
jgi:cobalt-precorrin 5A hydrolase